MRIPVVSNGGEVQITGKNVEINNLIIQNAFCGYGSAIGTDSKLTLNNVTFINCMGDNETYDGGAVYSPPPERGCAEGFAAEAGGSQVRRI